MFFIHLLVIQNECWVFPGLRSLRLARGLEWTTRLASSDSESEEELDGICLRIDEFDLVVFRPLVDPFLRCSRESIASSSDDDSYRFL